MNDRDQEIRELRQQVQDLTMVLEAFSLTQSQISDRETRADWYSQHWKSWQESRLFWDGSVPICGFVNLDSSPREERSCISSHQLHEQFKPVSHSTKLPSGA